MLAAGAWSNLFMLIDIFVPGSFSGSQGFGSGLDSWHGRIAVLNYVSLGSLTGLGSGEVSGPPARYYVDHVSGVGQFTLVIVVACWGARLSQAPPGNSRPNPKRLIAGPGFLADIAAAVS
jgi:hypothetical protein